MDLKVGNNYLLDTTVFIDRLRHRPAGKHLIAQAATMHTTIYYSIITEAELWAGIKPPRTEEEHKILLRAFTRIMVNVTIARRAGEYRQYFLQAGLGRKETPGLLDCMIAATAKFYNLRLVSRNDRHFGRFRQFNIAVDEYEVKTN